MKQNKKNKKNKKIIYVFVFFVFIICLAVLFFNQLGGVDDKLSVRLSWLMNSNQAGFVMADVKGFYKDEGLKVINRPGGVDFPSIQLVASGSDDVGVQSGAETILLARQNGIPIKAIAVLDKKSPYVFFSVKKNNILTPRDFAGKTIAVSYGRPLEMVYRALLNKENVDTSKITEIKKSPAILTLFSGSVDIQPGFVSDLIFAQEAGKKEGIELNVVRPADYGIKSYGYTIFVTDEMIEKHPDVVEKYLRATLRGWEYAVINPNESIDYVLSETDTELDREAQLKALRARKDFVLSGETPMGWMEEEVWQEMHDSLLGQGLLDSPVNLEDVYTNEFLKKIYGKI